ncbi:hypothetical protein VTJ83DRAFT_7090 [Remersonia thermophila]|uniref:Uncharacterized protein n=1 Tax=Remersonia thermophila TaxID=72144 RepID=A0ABR4D2H7_9PEZI
MGDCRPQKARGFLSLPAETRFEIYDLLLQVPREILTTPGTRPWRRQHRPTLGLLRVNKQIAAEAAERFYSINSFSLSTGSFLPRNVDRASALQWLSGIGCNALYIRSLTIRMSVRSNTHEHVQDHLEPFYADLVEMKRLLPNIRRVYFAYYALTSSPLHMQHDPWALLESEAWDRFCERLAMVFPGVREGYAQNINGLLVHAWS